jgi:hypothetical protein
MSNRWTGQDEPDGVTARIRAPREAFLTRGGSYRSVMLSQINHDFVTFGKTYRANSAPLGGGGYCRIVNYPHQRAIASVGRQGHRAGSRTRNVAPSTRPGNKPDRWRNFESNLVDHTGTQVRNNKRLPDRIPPHPALG